MKHFKKLVSATLAVLMASSCASAALLTVDAASNDALNSRYATNPNGSVGQRKTITVDGDISDWNSSMLIAQGTANDDPRVYRDNSMYEIPYDDYALYAAWDDSNLYLMWEMTNVQDVVAPNDTYPLNTDDRFVWQQNVPVMLAFDTDPAKGGNGTVTTGATMWDCNITYETKVDKLIVFSTRIYQGKNVNGPFVYTANENGLFEYNTDLQVSYDATGINMANGTGIVSEHVYGINGAYGHYNNRLIGDICNDDADWVDFNTLNHNSDLNDYHYEISIPLSQLGISSSYLEQTGIGVCKIQTSGASGMDCLPYDVTMNDNADQPDTRSQENNSFEKSDADHITTSFARIGKLSGDAPAPQPTTTQPATTQPATTQPATTQPATTQPATTQSTASKLTVNATSNLFPAKSLTIDSSEDTVTVNFDLKSTMKLVNGQATLSYDPNVLKLDSAKNTDIMPNISNETTNILTDYARLTFSDVDDLYDFTTEKNFASVTFDVLDSGSTTVDLKIDELSVGYKSGGVTSYKNAYVSGQKVDLSGVSGFSSSSLSGSTDITTTPESKLVVNSTSNFFPSTSKTYDADTKTIAVTYLFKSNFGIVDSQWKLTYDPTVLSYSSTNKKSTVMPNLSNTLLNKYSDGEIRGNVSGTIENDFSEEKEFVTVVFDVIGTGTTEVNLFVNDLSVGYTDENEDLNYAYIVDTSVVTDITSQPGFESESHSVKTVFDYSKTTIEGDVDMDGNFNVIDALNVLKYCADYITLTPEQLITADFNKDGRVNSLDVTAMQKRLADID